MTLRVLSVNRVLNCASNTTARGRKLASSTSPTIPSSASLAFSLGYTSVAITCLR